MRLPKTSTHTDTSQSGCCRWKKDAWANESGLADQIMRFVAMASDHLDAAGVRRTGTLYDIRGRKDGRNLSFTWMTHGIEPEFRNDAGFVRRTDTRQVQGSLTYRWWPEHWVINLGPRFNYDRNYDYEGVLQDEGFGAALNVQFARNVSVNGQVLREMERFNGVEYWKNRYNLDADVNTSRRIAFGGTLSTGDQVRFVSDAFLGSSTEFGLDVTLRPFSRLQSEISLDTSRFVDPRSATEVFDVKILRGLTTYQFTERLLIRNITEYNTHDRTLDANLLFTYRVNSGTVFYLGYDDHYQNGDQVNPAIFPASTRQRTNRAVFTKLQYLFRY